MIKEFLAKQALKYAAKDLSSDEQDAVLKLLEKNPELFTKIHKEMEALEKSGKPQVYAAMDVIKKYQKELQEVFKGVDPKVMEAIMSMQSKFSK